MLKQERQAFILHRGALSLPYSHLRHPSTPIYAHAKKKLIAWKAAVIQNDMFITDEIF